VSGEVPVLGRNPCQGTLPGARTCGHGLLGANIRSMPPVVTFEKNKNRVPSPWRTGVEAGVLDALADRPHKESWHVMHIAPPDRDVYIFRFRVDGTQLEPDFELLLALVAFNSLVPEPGETEDARTVRTVREEVRRYLATMGFA